MKSARCRVLPLPEHQVRFEVDGKERLRWHYGSSYPRPFFYPLLGPSGHPLTRMGHPGAPNHDHHRSVWLAHHKLNGVDFWSDQTRARVRQKQWLAMVDGPDEAAMAVLLGWFDESGKELMEQEVVVAGQQWRVGEGGGAGYFGKRGRGDRGERGEWR